MNNRCASRKNIVILAGLLIGSLGLVLMVNAVNAEANPQPLAQGTAIPQATATPLPSVTATAIAPAKACIECHPDKKDAWMESPHAHSADDPVFLEGWENMERSTECLLCHEATYQPETGEYLAKGVSCETCHGTASAEHPPAEVPARSDEEYCGTCHPTTLGEARISGHSTANEVRCVNCHDPHSQKVLFENPDDMCKDCHQDEDLGNMEQALSEIHLQENIACADCHMLDVPHTFVYNFQHEDTAKFFKGFDCTSEIAVSVAQRAGTDHEVLGSYVEDQMKWPVVHRISRLESAPQCADCHIMDEEVKADFMALGYTSEEVDQLSWESHDFPALTEAELNKVVAKPRKSWGWVYWVLGVAAVFGLFEFTVTRKLEGRPPADLKSLFSRFSRKNGKNKEDQQGKE